MTNNYNSFEEIDNQLKILSLQKQIYRERIKMNLKSAKINFNAANIKNEFKGAFQQKALTLLINNLIKIFR